MPRHRRGRGAPAGLALRLTLIAALVVSACKESSGRHTPAATAVTSSAAASMALLEALQRSLTSTWKVDEHFDRTAAGGGHIQAEQRRAQRPPDHLIVAGGTVDARLDDRVLACAADATGALRCRDAGAAQPYPDEVQRAVAALRSQVEGNNRLYDVTDAGGGCFALHLRVPGFVAPPYGTNARLCYDPATGAPSRTEIDRPEGRDVTVATAISANVTDADLAPPPA